MCASHRDDDRPGDGARAPADVEVGAIAHAINTPLAVALANTTYVLEHLASRPDADGAGVPLRGAVSEALAGLRRIQAAMEELAARVRPDEGAVDVRVVLDRAVAVLRAELGTTTLIRRFEPVPSVRGASAQLLLQVLTTTLASASMSSPGGSPPRILVRTSPAGAGLVAIDITTTGLGLAPVAGGPASAGDQAARQALDDALASLRATGASAVLSSTEHGSSARFELVAAPTPRPVVVEAVTSVRARVVVVDDEELIVKVVQRILGAEHDVVGFVDPEQALEHLLSVPRPDLVLCDLMMPRLSGADLFERVCAADATFADRFVFLSGGASGARPRAFLAAPTLVRLPKPFSAAVLRALVHERVARTRGG